MSQIHVGLSFSSVSFYIFCFVFVVYFPLSNNELCVSKNGLIVCANHFFNMQGRTWRGI